MDFLHLHFKTCEVAVRLQQLMQFLAWADLVLELGVHCRVLGLDRSCQATAAFCFVHGKGLRAAFHGSVLLWLEISPEP